MSLKAKWQDWFDKTVEECLVQSEGERIRAQGIIRGKNPDFTVQYKITMNDQWVFREAEIQSKDADDKGKQIFLSSDGNGRWTDYKNQRIEGLEEARDIDFILTPLTNTLPIKRLHLTRGESADITIASISFPALEVTPDTQRYTCIEPGRLYRFESLSSDFTQDIEFDEGGLVSNYPQMFKRVKLGRD
ncbi:MAG: putative glycolipid-binding domain-containing protein [Alphaproteobacteria bacterium]